MPEYTDPHKGEAILAECPYCHLPIYESDPRRMSHDSWDFSRRLYHSGCSSLAEGYHWEKQAKKVVDRLRGCGYIVELKITRPMR